MSTKKNHEQDLKIQETDITLQDFKESITEEVRLYYTEFRNFKNNDFRHLDMRVWSILVLMITLLSGVIGILVKVY